MSQVAGEQQSPLTVQLPPCAPGAGAATQAPPPEGVAQWPVPSQNAEQHCAGELQAVPFGTHPPQITPSKQ
jgi:hypothetical protein